MKNETEKTIEDLQERCFILLSKTLSKYGTTGNLITLAKTLLELDYTVKKVGYAPDVSFTYLPSETSAHYVAQKQKIEINYYHLSDILKRRLPFLVFFETVGHEARHHDQQLQALTAKSGYVSESEKSNVVDNLYYADLKDEDISTILAIINFDEDNQYTSSFDNLSDAEKENSIGDIVFSYYLQQKCEEDARKGGQEFVERMVQNLKSSPLCSEEFKKFFDNQLEMYHKFLQARQQNFAKYDGLSKPLEDELKKMSVEKFGKVENYLYEAGLKRHSPSFQINLWNVQKTFMKSIYIVFNEKSVEELESVFMYNLKHGNIYANRVINSILESKMTKAEKEEFSNKVYTSFLEGDLHKNSFKKFNLDNMMRFLTKEQLLDLSVKLLGKDKLGNACSLATHAMYYFLRQDSAQFYSDNKLRKPTLAQKLSSSKLFKPLQTKLENVMQLPLSQNFIRGSGYKTALKTFLPAYFAYTDRLIQKVSQNEPALLYDVNMLLYNIRSIQQQDGISFMFLKGNDLSSYGAEKLSEEYKKLVECKKQLESNSEEQKEMFCDVYGQTYADSVEKEATLLLSPEN